MDLIYTLLRKQRHLVMLMISVYFLPGVSTAQTSSYITIGSGSLANPPGQYPAPFGNAYEGARHQFLYRKAEIVAAGGLNGLITEFGFNVTYLNSGDALENYVLKIGQTNLDSIDVFQTGLTTAFSSAVYFPQPGWNMHSLSTKIPLDTSLNVIVEVCFSNPSGNYYQNEGTAYTMGLPNKTTVFNYGNMPNPCANTTNMAVSGFDKIRTNARFRVVSGGAPMTYLSTHLAQPNTLPVAVNKGSHEMMRIAVVTTGDASPLSLTDIELSLNGTTNPSEVANARIFYTAKRSTFDSTTYFGSVLNPGQSSVMVSGNQQLDSDTNYFWLVYDISPSSNPGNTFDAEILSVKLSGNTYLVNPSSAPGSRSILFPLSGLYYIGAGQQYVKLQDAVTDLSYRGINAPVDFILTDATDTVSNIIEIAELYNPLQSVLTIKPLSSSRIVGTMVGPVLQIKTSNVIIDGSANAFNPSRDLTFENINFAVPELIRFDAPGSKVLNNCGVVNTSMHARSAVSSGIHVSGGCRNFTFKNNSIHNTGVAVVINSVLDTTNMNVVIENNDLYAADTGRVAFGGIRITGVSGVRIINNKIGNYICNNPIDAGYGIEIGLNCENIIVERNELRRIRSNNLGGANGISVFSGRIDAGIIIRNNFIDSIYGPGTSTSFGFHSIRNPSGICLSGFQTGIQIVNNTIRLSGNTLIENAGNSAAVRIIGRSTAEIRNNYLHNTLGLAGSTGFGAFAITSLIPFSSHQFASVISNNNYYVGASGAGISAIGRISTSDYTTLSQWRNIVINDIGSVSENTPFVSATDLRIPAGTVSQMESNGVPVSGVDTDFDLDVRDLSFPDIGADEFWGVNIDSVTPVIVYSPFSGSSDLYTRTVNDIHITDFSGIATGQGTAPRIYYKRKAEANTFTGNSASDNGWKYTESYTGASPFSFTIDYSLLFGGTASVGDTIQYFIVAQDNSMAINPVSNPFNGFAGTSVSAVTSAPLTPNFYIITPAPLSGTYSIGNAHTYQTITAALQDLNQRGISGPVTFNLEDMSYSINETFPIVVKPVAGSSAINTVLLKPAPGIISAITGSSTNSVIRLEGVQYFTIDGSNNGTNSRDLTISNTNNGSVIHFASPGAAQGCTYDNIMNTVISSAFPNMSGTYGVFVGDMTLGGSGYDNNNIRIINNSISYVGVGVYVAGANPVNGLAISKNEIGINSPVFLTGIEVNNAMNPLILDNRIENVKSLLRASWGGPAGIRMINTHLASIIGNRIAGIAYTGTNGGGAKGIEIYDANTAARIQNNFIGEVYSDCNTAGAADITLYSNHGILLRNGSGHQVNNNSIWMSGNRNANAYAGALSSGIFIGTGLSGLDVRNNLVQNTQTSSNPNKGSNYGIYSQTPVSGFTFLDHNNYYVNSDTAGINNAVGFINGADQVSLAAWKAATGKETASNNDSIQYVSLTNLHLTGTSIGNVHFAGAPVSGITTDIDGDARNTLYPYMGADENTNAPLPVELLQLAAHKQAEQALLSWATAIETNNAYFIIERSIDAKIFAEAGRVRGQGNSRNIINYLFTDETAAAYSNTGNGTVYYRLAQVDVDGKMTYSEMVSVSFGGEKPGIGIYPNPVSSTFTLANISGESGTMQVVIVDITGSELLNTSIHLSASIDRQVIDMSKFDKGIYFVKTIINNRTESHKVIKN